jgi:hypothetical protein
MRPKTPLPADAVIENLTASLCIVKEKYRFSCKNNKKNSDFSHLSGKLRNQIKKTSPKQPNQNRLITLKSPQISAKINAEEKSLFL